MPYPADQHDEPEFARREQEILYQRLEDVGQRYNHYRDLVDMWEDALRVVSSRGYQDDVTKETALNLKSAIKLVNKQIENMANFAGKHFSLACEINSINPQKLLGDGKCNS